MFKTKYLSPTLNFGSRMKATYKDKSVTVSYDYNLTEEENHYAVAKVFADKYELKDVFGIYINGSEMIWGRIREKLHI